MRRDNEAIRPERINLRGILELRDKFSASNHIGNRETRLDIVIVNLVYVASSADSASFCACDTFFPFSYFFLGLINPPQSSKYLVEVSRRLSPIRKIYRVIRRA